MKTAKIRHRVLAGIVDCLIVTGFLVIIFIGYIIGFLAALVKDAPITTTMIMKLINIGAVSIFVLLGYYMFFPMFFKGQTPGKMLFKIKIVNDDGTDVDYKTLFFREGICKVLVEALSIGLSIIVSLLVMILRKDKKSFADVFAKTKVIDIKEEH